MNLDIKVGDRLKVFHQKHISEHFPSGYTTVLKISNFPHGHYDRYITLSGCRQHSPCKGWSVEAQNFEVDNEIELTKEELNSAVNMADFKIEDFIK